MTQPRYRKLREVLARVLDYVPMPLLRAVAPGRILALGYHVVSSEALEHVRHLYDYESPEQFEQDLVYLKSHFHIASLTELVAHTFGEQKLPKPFISISFDDGFAECFSVVRPLLLKHGIPCTFFVCAGLLDNRAMMFRNKVSLCLGALEGQDERNRNDSLRRASESMKLDFQDERALQSWLWNLTYLDRDVIDAVCDLFGVDVDEYLELKRPYMTREQVLRLHEEGFSIGAHSVNHPELWLLEWEEAEREIVDSCRAVAELTDQDTVPFAFPFTGLPLSRGRLVELRRRHENVGLLFDANNLKRDKSFIVNRIMRDGPGSDHRRTSLGSAIRMAYAAEPFRSILRGVRGRGSARGRAS